MAASEKFYHRYSKRLFSLLMKMYNYKFIYCGPIKSRQTLSVSHIWQCVRLRTIEPFVKLGLQWSGLTCEHEANVHTPIHAHTHTILSLLITMFYLLHLENTMVTRHNLRPAAVFAKGPRQVSRWRACLALSTAVDLSVAIHVSRVVISRVASFHITLPNVG